MAILDAFSDALPKSALSKPIKSINSSRENDSLLKYVDRDMNESPMENHSVENIETDSKLNVKAIHYGPEDMTNHDVGFSFIRHRTKRVDSKYSDNEESEIINLDSDIDKLSVNYDGRISENAVKEDNNSKIDEEESYEDDQYNSIFGKCKTHYPYS